MTGTVAAAWRRACDGFTARADAVGPGQWEQPSPCAGWVARDVVGHLVEWVPGFLRAGAGIELAAGPPVDRDPAAAWRSLAGAVTEVLDDDDAALRPFELAQTGRSTVAEAIAAFVLPDVLIHTWDLARATGQDERLDAELVRAHLAGLASVDEDALVASGQFGPRVNVPDDADDQTRLLAVSGRRA